MPQIHCTLCGQIYPHDQIPFLCPNCGGVFDFDSDFDVDLNKLDHSSPGIWRFNLSHDPGLETPIISLGEGNTPLIWTELEGLKIGLKSEHLNPTGSYKDRGSSVLVSHLVARGVKNAVEDSSGNAGASFAAYTARAGIHASIFVPSTAS
jgi:threonine synthase